MSVTTTPNMGLVLPVPTSEPGPAWAQELITALNLVDAHTHASGSGVLITPSGINITGDLAFNNNHITLLRSLRLYPNAATIAGASPDLGCLYRAGVDLYYNDGGGNQIRITQSGSVAGSAGTITGLPSGTASAAFQSVPGTFQFLQATSTAANIDAATYILRYPGGYPTPSGNYIALQAPSSLATGYAFTLPATLPASSGAFLTSSTAGAVSYTNVDNSTIEINAAVLRLKASGVTGSQIATNINLPGKAVKENSLNLVVSNTNATNSLAIVRGHVASNAGIVAGEGFTVNHVGTGDYIISFSAAFADTPVVTFQLVAWSAGGGGSAYTWQMTNLSTSSFEMVFLNSSFIPADTAFTFIAIGQRA